MYRFILYVSRSCLAQDVADASVQRIVDVSGPWNTSQGISGALAFTGDRFAQVIEGPGSAIAELLRRLRRDPRHSDINVVQDRASLVRRFAGWSMAYSGPRELLAPQLAPLLLGAPGNLRDGAANDLVALMQAFTMGR